MIQARQTVPLPFALAILPVSIALLSFVSLGSGATELTSATRPCSPMVKKGMLPAWARAGFHGSTRVPHVLGRSGGIIGILFQYPLKAPPPTDRNDKILWVSRLSYTWRATLRISAQRMNGTRPVGAPVKTSVKGGPGPSSVDLTTPGCWRLSLDWAGHSDTVDLQYRSP